MKTFLIIHGIKGRAAWQQWLHDELVKTGAQVIMPDLPNVDRPDRKTWLKELQSSVKNVKTEDLIIVGHSLGVPAALDLIETLPSAIAALISVSGFADDYKAELNSYYMAEKLIDFININPKIKKAYVIYGDDDPYVPQESLATLAQKLTNSEIIVVEKGGHLSTSSGFTEFPLLLDLINEV